MVKNNKHVVALVFSAVVLIPIYLVLSSLILDRVNISEEKANVINWIGGLTIAAVCLILVLIAAYRLYSNGSTEEKPSFILNFIKRHIFLLVFFFGTLLLTGEFSYTLTPLSVALGWILDFTRLYLKASSLKK